MRPIHLTDLIPLATLFSFSNYSIFIYDPKQRLVRTSHKEVQIFSDLDNLVNDLSDCATIISLSAESIRNQLPQQCAYVLMDFGFTGWPKNFKKQTFLYFPNPDGTIRWLTPIKNNNPSFLNLYNGSGMRGWLYKFFYKCVYRLGLKHMVCAGSLTVATNGQWPLSKLGFEHTENNFSIFTGTIGSNRKLIIERSEYGKTTHFLKFPITKKSRELVSNECTTLQNISKLTLKKWEVAYCLS